MREKRSGLAIFERPWSREGRGSFWVLVIAGSTLITSTVLVHRLFPGPERHHIHHVLEITVTLVVLALLQRYWSSETKKQVDSLNLVTKQQRILAEVFWLQESFLDPDQDRDLRLGLVHEVLQAVSGASVSAVLQVQELPDGKPETVFDLAPNLPREGMEEILRGILATSQRVLCYRGARSEQGECLGTEDLDLDCFLGFPLSCGGKLVGAVGLGKITGDFEESVVKDLELLLQTLGMLLRSQDLEQHRRHFVGQRHMLEDAVEHLDECVAVTDLEGRFLYANPALEKLSGYSLEELLAATPKLFKSGRHDAEFYRELWETIRAGKSWSGRMINRRKDGTLWTEFSTISPVEVDGKTVQYVKVSRSIDAEMALEQKLRQHQKLEAMGTLSGGIAHEFNNVLGMILGYVELARDEVSRESPLRGDLDKVLEATDRGANLVRQILAFSRQVEGDPQPLEVQGVIKETLKMLRSSLPSSLELQIDLEAGTDLVVADPAQIRQLVVNLVTNAAQSMEESPGKISGHLKPVQDARGRSWLELEIRDQGCGIPEEMLSRVFDPFFTTRAQAAGGGLGLSVVHGIVQACRGTVEMQSKVGEGTSVRIRLPIHVSVSEVSAPQENRTFSGSVLAVDDEELLLETVRRTLEGLGFEVEAYKDSEEAQKKIESDAARYDLLFTDLTMPRVSGLDLARAFKQQNPGGKVILHTGFGGDAALNRGAGEGIIDKVLFKPLRRARLVESLGKILPAS